ncbi:MAG: 30S ribosomal protein S8 [Acholeplasmatales bacterium]|nr:30S ribosomal protein S8 [Acholeplasmatales bacterium]
MAMTDPIADMLTRIRNANKMLHETVEIPASNIKTSILNVFKNEGFIADFKTESLENNKSVTTVTLKYIDNKERVIKGLKRISKPGLRVYVEADKLPKVLNGLGVAVISTSKGVMTDKDARKQKLGGEVLAYIW